MTIIPWDGDAMSYAKAHVAAGVLTIDEQGRVWRHAIFARGHRRPVAPRRAENPSGNGYLRISLHVHGKGLVQVMAHRLVYECIVGHIPDGLQINHRDLNKQNNAPSNLETCTASENIRHSYANGRPAPWCRATMYRGRPRGNTPANRASAKTMRQSGASLRAIAEALRVSVSHAHRLCHA